MNSLLLVHGLPQQFTEAKRRIREARHPALDYQPLVGLADETPILVRADAIMLRQVVLNLMNNAIDALGGPGRVVVCARIERNGIGSALAMVSVSDTGRGVPAEHLARIFDPFFTTKDVGQGVGLGLAICQSFVEQHGGTIRAQSPGVGGGTTVEFELPLEV